MKKTILLLVLFLFGLNNKGLLGNENNLEELSKVVFTPLLNWKESQLLKETPRQPARTAILIIVPPSFNNTLTHTRWKLGKKVWQQYMKSHPKVDCYFIQSTLPRKKELNQVWVKENTLYVGDRFYEKYQEDRILHKTIMALEFLAPHYTHFIRTNLNTFFNLKVVNGYMEKHHQSFYTNPIWETGFWYPFGYGIIFTKDVAKLMVKEYRKLEKNDAEWVSHEGADDAILTAMATGVWPDEHPYIGSSKIIYGIQQLMSEDSLNVQRLSRYGVLLTSINSLKAAIHLVDQAGNVMLYRTREGLSLEDFAKFYEYLLDKNYPGLTHINLVEYVNKIDVSSSIQIHR